MNLNEPHDITRRQFTRRLALPAGALLLGGALSAWAANQKKPSRPSPASQPESAVGKVEIFTLSGGPDPTFEELLKTHQVIGKNGQPELSATKPILGSTVHVNHQFLEQGLGQVANPGKFERLHIKMAVRAAGGAKGAAKNYTRWYQVDGNTQIFRMFNHDKEQSLKVGCRVEVYTHPFSVKNRVVVWEGSYCVPDTGPTWQGKGWNGGIAFQIGNLGEIKSGSYPYFSMRAGEEYECNHRFPFQKSWSGEKTHTLLKNGREKNFPMRFRYDGHYYEISTRNPDGTYKVLDGGSLPTVTNEVSFRWGCYVGHKSETGVTGNKLIFVTGAKVYIEEGATITPPAWVPASCLSERAPTKAGK